MHAVHRIPVAFARLHSTSPVKPSIKLVAELRKIDVGITLSKARQALIASNNDLEGALDWLNTDRKEFGKARVEKLAGRVAGQGLIGVQVLSPGLRPQAGSLCAAMVELNCETEFVARNELFGKLLSDIAHTAAFLKEPSTSSSALIQPVSVDALNNAPLLDHLDPQRSMSAHTTVESAIRDLVTKVGEKVMLKRAVAVAVDPISQKLPFGMRVFSYIHGSVTASTNGTKAALSLLRFNSPQLPSLISSTVYQDALTGLEQSLGRTIVGFPIAMVRSPGEPPHPEALYDQPSDLFKEREGQTVEAEMRIWSQRHGLSNDTTADPNVEGVDVTEFVKWAVGEPLQDQSS